MISDIDHPKPHGIFSAFTLKCIAIASMLIDHIGYILVPPGVFSLTLRLIGRISFPIFCFLIVESYYHTHNLKKYILRLSVFALVSEVPFDLAFRHNLIYWQKQNVFFTLLIGLIMIALIDRIFNRLNQAVQAGSSHIWVHAIAASSLCLAVAFAAFETAVLLRVDYSRIGIFTILAFYIFRRYFELGVLSLAAINLYFGGFFQTFAVFSAIPLMLYNREKGRSLRWLFYFFYPIHLFILYLIDIIT